MNKRKSKGKEKDVIKRAKTNSSIFTYEIYPTKKLKVGFEISYARGYAYVSKCRKNTKVKKGDTRVSRKKWTLGIAPSTTYPVLRVHKF